MVTKLKTGNLPPKRIVYLPQLCSGCRGCEIICSLIHEKICNPNLARLHVSRHPFAGKFEVKVDEKCDLCSGQLECVRWCPMGALKYLEE